MTFARAPLIAVATRAEAAPWGLTAETVGTLVVAGVGQASVAPVAAALERFRPGVLLSFGYAGALGPALAPGAIVVLDWTAAGPGTRSATDPEASERLHAALSAAGAAPERGGVVHVDSALHDPGLRDRLAADTGAAVVDMESAIWHRLAEAAGVPFVAVRVVSDRADLALPELRHRILEANGAVRWSRWLAALRRQGRTAQQRSERPRVLRAATDWAAATAALARAAGVLRAALIERR